MTELTKKDPISLVKKNFSEAETIFLTKAMPAIQERLLLYKITPEGDLASEREELDKIRFKPQALCTLLLTFKAKGLNRIDFEEACHILQGYIENNKKGQKYTNHAAAIRSWVIDKVLERKRKEADLERSEMYRDKAVGVMIGEGKK